MNLLPFDQQTLGDVGYELATFSGSLRAVGIWGNDTAVAEVQTALIQQGWGVTEFSMTPAGFASNFWNISFTVNAICGDDRNRIINAITNLLEGRGFYEVNISFRGSSGCDTRTETPVPNAPTTRPRIVPLPTTPTGSPAVDPNYVYQAGDLATVTVNAPSSSNWIWLAAAGLGVLLLVKE